MGNSASKASKAAGSAARQYPKRPPPPPSSSSAVPQPPPAQDQQPGPTVRPRPQASANRSEAINLDASDPDFARSLRQIGAVQPNPTMSPTSAFPHPNNPNNPSIAPRPTGPDPRTNPAITVLDSRSRLQAEADREFIEAGKRGHEGRQFLDVFLIRQILTLRDKHNESAGAIESKLGLKAGVVDRLGGRGITELAQDVGRAEKGVDMV